MSSVWPFLLGLDLVLTGNARTPMDLTRLDSIHLRSIARAKVGEDVCASVLESKVWRTQVIIKSERSDTKAYLENTRG